MAHLWVANDKGDWVVQPLHEDFVALVGRSVGLMRVPGPSTELWILMSGCNTDVRINGLVAAGGLRVLCDRDEIYVDAIRRYFSTETLARITEMAGMDPSPRCPRCQQAIQEGTSAVRCPHCGIWHHQSDALPCWAYADTCASCPQPTDLEAGFRWTPEREAS